ncbi:MAG TPA: hypothetical protein DCL75_00780 [Ktedonobacter sp.]|nr:hypothetical protein [Ktedonobacter sp.]
MEVPLLAVTAISGERPVITTTMYGSYQQDGKPCLRCGTLVERIVIGQRSAHFCPGCQKLTVE